MLRFIVRRLLQLIPILLGLSVLLFAWLRALPGGPAVAALGERATPAKIAEYNRVFGLDQPIWEQYLRFLGRAVRLDFGTSQTTGRPVTTEFLTRFPGTVELTIFAMVFAIGVGIPLGYLAARKHGSWIDSASVIGSLLGVAIPVFFLAYLLRLLFAVELGWLPGSGRQDVRIDATHITNFYVLDGLMTREWDAAWDALQHLVLPGIALGTIPLAIIVRITRASVLDVVNEDYVRTAKAKGLATDTVRRRHILRNALLPVSTTIGLLTGLLLSGAVLTETVFAFGGVGSALRDAISNRDYADAAGLHPHPRHHVRAGEPAGRHLLRPARPEGEGRVTASLGDRKRERIDALAARAGALPEGDGGVSLVKSAYRRLRRDPVAILGAVIVVVFLLVALFAPLAGAAATRYAQALLSEVRQGSIPGAREGFPLGVDQLGRDLLSRLIYGSRQSLLIGVVSTVLGAVVGMAAGRAGRGVRRLGRHRGHAVRRHPAVGARPADGDQRSRCCWAQNQSSLMIAIAVTQVPMFARLLRGSMLVQRDSDYAVAAQALGVQAEPDRAGPRAAQLAVAGDRAGHAVPGDGDHRGGGAVVPRSRRPGHRPAGVGGDAGQRAGRAVGPAAAGHLPGALHHRRRARLHAAR